EQAPIQASNAPKVQAEIREGGDVVTTPSDAPSPPILEPARPTSSPPLIQPDEVGTVEQSSMVHADSTLREPTAAETDALLAY
ncbi:hypothetical protein PI124_g20468, partial [Phytophthora idaei]